MRSLFIVFEGIDGSGKSTQAEMLQASLKDLGVDTVLFMEPSGGPWGRKIRSLLGGKEMPPADELLELFILDREDDARENILPALGSGKTVILDRYFYSNAAYQGAMGLDAGTILEENRRRSFPEPKRVYFIDISPENALKRIAERNRSGHRDIFEKKAFLEQVRHIFLSMADKRFLIVNGERPPQEIHEEILADYRNTCAEE